VTKDLYIAKMDHIAETEDELMVLCGEVVSVFHSISDLCCIAVCSSYFLFH